LEDFTMAAVEQLGSSSALKENYRLSDPIDRVRAVLTPVCCHHAQFRRNAAGRLEVACTHSHPTAPEITAADADDPIP
jgi:phage gp36-like protein